MSDYEELQADPCRAESTFSWPRFLAFAFLFTVMLGGGALFILLGDAPYGVQFASAVAYTAAVVLYGFAKNRSGIVPYLFTCPVVVNQYVRLLNRHTAFLAILVAFETIALRAKPHLPAWWLTSSGSNPPPFVDAVALPCIILGIVEIATNRAVLARAHSDRFGDLAAKDQSDNDKLLSIFSKE